MTRLPHPLLYVAAGGFVGGMFDIVYACTFWAIRSNAPPQRIFQSVAAGLLGKASFEGGWPTAALGLALHFFIATSMSLTYYLVARQWPLLRDRAVLCGAAYGVLLYLVMTYVVVPLSRASSSGNPPTVWIVLSVLVHSLLIGLPIALYTRDALRN